jgi:hypothetical protein
MLVGTFGVAAFEAATPASAADSPIEQRGRGHVTSDPLPTVQINGVVWDQTVIGNRVYAVGSFTRARPAGSAPGQNEIHRANILAYDIVSGELDTRFKATLNAEATTVVASPDGSVLYIGGMFTSVNGFTRYRIAALDPVTGALKPGFNAAVDYRVNVLVADDDTLYAGGAFSTAHGDGGVVDVGTAC